MIPATSSSMTRGSRTSEFETPTAAANLPIPLAEFERMARYGRDQLRAAIVIRKGPDQ